MLQQVLSACSDVFTSPDFDLGRFSPNGHGDVPPFCRELWQTTLGFQEEEKAHLKLMVVNGIIQPSLSE